MIETILSKTIAGAFVGYITNDLAIQMLFRKRLGLGGIFLKTRNEFIENISQIVERDIINHRTLEDELKNESFDLTLENTVRHYFEKNLPETAEETMLLSEIPGIENSVQNLLRSFELTFPDLLLPFLRDAAAELTVADLFSPEQSAHAGETAAKLFVEKITIGNAAGKIITDIYENKFDAPVGEMLAEGLWQQISHNISQNLHAEIPPIIASEETKNALDIVFFTAEIPKICEKIARGIAEKKIADIIGENYSLELQKEILLRLKTVLSSQEGEEVFISFARVLIFSLEREEKTLFELLNEDLGTKIRLFFKETFPDIFKKIIEWLQSRRKKIEELVDATFTQSIDSKFKSWIVETFVGSVSKSADVVGKLTEILENYGKNPEKIAKTISEQITDFLSKQSIGSIVRLLKASSAITHLAQILQKNIVSALTELPPQQNFFTKKIGDYFPSDKIAIFLQKNIYRLLTETLPQNLQKDRRILLALTGEINNVLDDLLLKKTGTIFSKEQVFKFSHWIDEYTADIVQINAAQISFFLSKLIAEQAAGKNLNVYIANEQLQNFSFSAAASVKLFAENEFKNLSNKQLQEYFRLLNRIPDVHKSLSVAAKSALMKNLPSLMSGRIEDVVRTNLNHQSQDTIRDMVEKFMGKELKPITAFGALLGAATGFALPFVPSSQNFYIDSGVSAVTYGFTGMGTNWVALKMIFKPHYKKTLLGIHLPFTPGVAVKNQKRFAKNMGDFVGNKLLNKDGLALSIEKNKDKITDLLNDVFVKNNFEQAEKFIQTHKDTLSENAASKLLNLADSHENLLKEYILKFFEKFKKTTLENFNTEAFEKKIYQFLSAENSLIKLEDKLTEALQNYLTDKTPLAQKITPELKNRICIALSDFVLKAGENYLDKLNEKELLDVVNPFIDANYKVFTEKNIIQLLGEEQTLRAQKSFSKFIFAQLQNDNNQKKIFDFVEAKIGEEIAHDKKIGELFGGKLLGLVTGNFDFIIKKILQSSLDWLRENADTIAEQVYESSFREQKSVFLYKDNIKKTVRDLATNGIPVFIAGEKESLTELIGKEIARLGEVNLGQIGVNVRQNDLREMIVNLLKSNRLITAIDELSESLMSAFFTLPLKSLLYVVGIENAKNVLSLFENELHILLSHLQELFKTKKEDIAGSIENLAEIFLSQFLTNLTLSDLTADTGKEDWQKAVRKGVEVVLSNDAFELQAKKTISEIFSELKGKPADEWLLWESLPKNVDEIWQKIFKNENLRQSMHEALRLFSDKNLATLNNNINPETKIFLVDTLVKALLAAMSEKLPGVLESLDIKKVVVREIEKMPPHEIEELFNSFAKKYFEELVNYGFGFGIIFGLLADLLFFGAIKAVQ